MIFFTKDLNKINEGLSFWQNFHLINMRLIYWSSYNYIILLIIPGSLYAASRVFVSSLQQYELLNRYNFASTEIDLDELDSYEMDFPSVTATTIPLKAMKAFFYLKNGRIDESFDLFHSSMKYKHNYIPV